MRPNLRAFQGTGEENVGGTEVSGSFCRNPGYDPPNENHLGFSRRGPDRVAEELATVLSSKATFEFKALFTVVHANLRARNAAGGGEEMLRLRAYEKLQNLVQAGVVKKTGKEYKGVPAALVTFMETAAELNAKFAAGTHSRPPTLPAVEAKSPAVKTVAPAVKRAKARVR